MISPGLLALIICPACGGALEPSPKHESLRCVRCGNSYPVENGIPILIVDPPVADPGTSTDSDA